MKVRLFVLRSLATAQLGDDSMPEIDRPQDRKKEARQPPPKKDLVITPAGPIEKENVHGIGPNETVRRNEDGTYAIVPSADSK
jgi:hypothetical protein